MFGLFPIQVLGAECRVELLSSYKRVKINLLFTEPSPLYSLAQLDKHATNVSSL